MKIHHLNCMSFHAFGFPEVTHVLLLETKDGLILIDSGLGLDDFACPNWVEWLSIRLSGVTSIPEDTPIRQLDALGFDPREVRDIVPTHLHWDHIGGACDFPWAKIHVWEVELAAGLHPSGWKGLFGYAPERWKDHPGLTAYTLGDERWFGLEAMPVIQRDAVEIWLVPLVGHSPGMCGVAIKTDDGWLWHCGDAYVRQFQVEPEGPGTAFPSIARGFENSMFPLGARQKVRTVLEKHGDNVTAFCSHDTEMFYKMKDNAF